MVSDLDIYRTAQVLVKTHGTDAWFHAATRADELLDQGDTEGAAVWRRIGRAVDELLNETPPGTTH